jgi:hypothetical protein
MTPISTMSIMSSIATSATPKFGMERLNPTRGLAVPELDRLALVGRPGGATDPIAEQGSRPEWSGQGWPEAITK